VLIQITELTLTIVYMIINNIGVWHHDCLQEGNFLTLIHEMGRLHRRLFPLPPPCRLTLLSLVTACACISNSCNVLSSGIMQTASASVHACIWTGIPQSAIWPGLSSWQGQTFPLATTSILSLGLTQYFSEGKNELSMKLRAHHHPAASLRMCRAVPPRPLIAFLLYCLGPGVLISHKNNGIPFNQWN
jgi:hypothetical protein